VAGYNKKFKTFKSFKRFKSFSERLAQKI